MVRFVRLNYKGKQWATSTIDGTSNFKVICHGHCTLERHVPVTAVISRNGDTPTAAHLLRTRALEI